MMAHLPVLVVVVPLLSALFVPLVGRFGRAPAHGLVVLALAFSTFGSWHLLQRANAEGVVRYAMGGWPAPTGIEYVVDTLNALVLLVVASVALISAIWMVRGMAMDIASEKRVGYLAILLLFATGLMGIAITGDIFNLYVFIEIASITGYVLIGMGKRREALYAGFSYLVLGSIGATFVLLGIGYLYQATGSLDMADIAARLPALGGDSRIGTAYAFFLVGLAIKMALFPLHGWQPGAYTHAPAGATILLAATSTKVFAYVLYRLTFEVFGIEFLTDTMPILRTVLLLVACTAIVVGPLLALRQDNLKRLLAYSSVGQIGYFVLALGLANATAMSGGIAHLLNHAAAKGALFAVAGVLAFGTGSVRVERLEGLGRKAPWTAVCFTLAGLSMIGVPLTAGFQSKLPLALGALEAGYAAGVAVLLLSSLLTALYVGRLLRLVWFGSRDVDLAPADPPWCMRLPTLVLAGACLVMGVTPWAGDWARLAAERLFS